MDNGGNRTRQGYARKRILKLAGHFFWGALLKPPYRKPALSYDQQIAKLRERGMIVADENAARFYLQHLNYYRLGAYWLPFETDHKTHQLKSGTRFEDVLALYNFDRELRLLVMDAMERIEVSVRAQWAYQLGHLHGAHAQLASGITRNPHHWQHNLDDLTKEVKRSEETFIQHFANNYAETMPPVWAVCEVMSLGLLSRWYRNLKPKHTRQKIANAYGIDETVLESWLHHLAIVRNICAHHSRLWDRSFTILPQAPRSKPTCLVNAFVQGSRKPYNTIVMVLYLMDVVSPQHHWRSRLLALLAKNASVLSAMDFPADWNKQLIWQTINAQSEQSI